MKLLNQRAKMVLLSFFSPSEVSIISFHVFAGIPWALKRLRSLTRERMRRAEALLLAVVKITWLTLCWEDRCVQVFVLSLKLNASAQECWGDMFWQWHLHGRGFFFNFVDVAKVGMIKLGWNFLLKTRQWNLLKNVRIHLYSWLPTGTHYSDLKIIFPEVWAIFRVHKKSFVQIRFFRSKFDKKLPKENSAWWVTLRSVVIAHNVMRRGSKAQHKIGPCIG